MTVVDELNRRLASVPRISSVVGTFVGLVDGLARVNVQGSSVDVRCDGWNPPIAGMPVRVESVDGVMRVVGPSQTLSPLGVVTESVGGGVRAAVTVGDSSYVLPVVAPYSPVPEDTVVINWFSGHILGEQAAAPEVEVPEAKPDPGPQPFRDLLMYPTASGKWDTAYNNWWGGSEVWASNNNRGIWVYGGRNSMLAGANVQTVEVFLPRITEVGSASIGLHGYSGIPGGYPTMTDGVSLAPRDGWVRLPDWWGNHLRDNPNSGVGVFSPSGGYNKWRGVGQDAMSGVLRFTGTR